MLEPVDTACAAIRLDTGAPSAGAERLGLVRHWGHDADLAHAERAALQGVHEQAAAVGATAVADLHVDVTPDTHLRSDSPALGRLVYVSSDTFWLVYVYGTAVREP